MTKSVKDTTKKRENYMQISLMNICVKPSTKYQQIEFTVTLEGTYMIKWDLSQKHKYSSISTSQHDNINKLKNKIHMIISTDTGKAFDKIQHPFLTKTLNKMSMEVIYLNMIKAIYI